jgi:elongation factor G
VRGIQVVDSEVPLSEMFGYANALRSVSQGRANYSMQFKEYRETPASIQEAIVSERKK